MSFSLLTFLDDFSFILYFLTNQSPSSQLVKSHRTPLVYPTNSEMILESYLVYSLYRMEDHNHSFLQTMVLRARKVLVLYSTIKRISTTGSLSKT